MREVISEYGRSLLAAIATIGILALVLGLLAMSGELMSDVSASGRAYETGTMKEAMARSFDRGISDLELRDSVSVWETFDLRDMVSYGGRDSYEVHILKVSDDSGTDVTSEARCGRSSLCFEKEGVYSVMAEFSDEAGVSSIRKLYIGVGQS